MAERQVFAPGNVLKMSDGAVMDAETVQEGEKYEFQAEVGRVMDIIINSLYSNRDVFLRELVSNAADACDKKRFLSITAASDDPTSASLEKPAIRIKADKDAMTVTIEDSGVGMTKQELINNLGRIAQSGTKKFLEALGEGSADVNLIGQFGVGFYSAYLVADKVEVVTKSMQGDSKQYKWTSDASNSYTIAEDNSDPINGSGTRLILHLKDDALEYCEPSKLEELLQHYSEFVEFPISVWKEKTEYKQVPDEEANKDLPEGEEPKMKTVPETTESYEQMNTNKPIWLRSPSEVTEEEYKDFYQSAFRATYDEPLAHTHFSLEGQIECKSILYIPGMLPFELSKDMFDEDSRNIRLYVKRVFINDKFEDIVPRWLKFVRGVVDSQDLPLNVSREILQKSKVLSIINKRLVRKSLDMIQSIASDEDESKYIMFWNNFGKYLKVGVIEDQRSKDDIIPLLRFFSSKSVDEYTSLDQYVEGMKEGQKSIYYVTSDGKEKAKMSPAAEKVRSRGYEVLYLTEPLDEIMIESVSNYKDFRLVDVAKEGLNLDGEDKEERKKKEEELNESYKSLKDYLEGTLAGKVQRVKITDLLSESPAALVQSAYGMSPTMQRYMKAQNVASGGADTGRMGNFNQAVLEVNPSHPIVQDLERLIRAEGEQSSEAKNFAVLLYDVAALTSGYEIEDSGDFAQRIMAMMTSKAKSDIQDAEVEVVTEAPADAGNAEE
jgi:heat shock protein beta